MQSRPTIDTPTEESKALASVAIELLIQKDVITRDLALEINDDLLAFLEKQDFTVLAEERIIRLKAFLPLFIFGFFPTADEFVRCLAPDFKFEVRDHAREELKLLLSELLLTIHDTSVEMAFLEFFRAWFILFLKKEKTFADVVEESCEYILKLPVEQTEISSSASVDFLIQSHIISSQQALSINRGLFKLLEKQNFPDLSIEKVERLKLLMSILMNGMVRLSDVVRLNVDVILNCPRNLDYAIKLKDTFNGFVNITSTPDFTNAFKPFVQDWINSLLRQEKSYEQVKFEYMKLIFWLRQKSLEKDIADSGEDLSASKVKSFIKIYNALRDGQGMFKRSSWVKSKNIAGLSSGEALALIEKHAADKGSRTSQAWSLCSAFYAGALDQDELRNSVYLAAFDNTFVFKKSSHFGQTFYSSKSLRDFVGKNMRASIRDDVSDDSRMGRIMKALN
jgi:hypothetical protein